MFPLYEQRMLGLKLRYVLRVSSRKLKLIFVIFLWDFTNLKEWILKKMGKKASKRHYFALAVSLTKASLPLKYLSKLTKIDISCTFRAIYLVFLKISYIAFTSFLTFNDILCLFLCQKFYASFIFAPYIRLFDI